MLASNQRLPMLTALLFAPQISLGLLSVVDGDTLHDNRRNQDYRLYGVDVPETTRAKCEAERALRHGGRLVPRPLLLRWRQAAALLR